MDFQTRAAFEKNNLWVTLLWVVFSVSSVQMLVCIAGKY
jgi:hypothetical protein